uniref:Innexin n=1 Tax=Angiostrongylus cantonensis TaxID=6313 RepID=A0A158PB08_ANGCA
MLSNINNYIRQVKSTHDDDSIDRLNYVTTIYMLLGFALTLFAKNYVGEPMQCWVPNQWTAVWEVFSESYCFVENTYFVPMNDSNMPAVHTREGRKMIYYQWVPFILSLMAFCFYIPRGIWKIFSPYSVFLDSNFLKVLIFVNLLLQFFLLNHFLGTAYTFWGAGILFDMIRGRQWQNSGHFPRVAFCDLTVREMGNVNNWTVQCVLMVNMFNEKIFIFLWFWFAFLLFCTVINLFIWIHRRISRAARMAFLYDVLVSLLVKYVYTPWILCGTAFLVFAKEYVGTAIQCWVPRQWSKSNISEVDLPSVTVALRKQAKTIRDPLDVNMILKPARRGWKISHFHTVQLFLIYLCIFKWFNRGLLIHDANNCLNLINNKS